MSLATICRNVLAETGWPVMNGFATNSDATAQQVFTLANTTLLSLSEEFSWPQLETEYVFNTAADQSVYLWPSDFRVLAKGAVFNAAEYYEVKGSTGLQYWQMLKYGKLGNLRRTQFRVVYPLGAPGIEITPAPAGAQQLIAVYYTSMFARQSDGTLVSQYMQDTDVSVIPERYVELGLKWRFRRAKGLDFSAELAEYNSTIQTQYAKYKDSGEIQVGGRRCTDDYLPQGYVRENGFGV